jgi:hypothetical protein
MGRLGTRIEVKHEENECGLISRFCERSRLARLESNTGNRHHQPKRLRLLKLKPSSNSRFHFS